MNKFTIKKKSCPRFHRKRDPLYIQVDIFQKLNIYEGSSHQQQQGLFVPIWLLWQKKNKKLNCSSRAKNYSHLLNGVSVHFSPKEPFLVQRETLVKSESTVHFTGCELVIKECLDNFLNFPSLGLYILDVYRARCCRDCLVTLVGISMIYDIKVWVLSLTRDLTQFILFFPGIIYR